jgi:DNA-binding CsgD family transcriptional regulator
VDQVVSRQQRWAEILLAIHQLPTASPRPTPAVKGPKSKLTARELEVLGLVAEGWRTAEVSTELGISPKTVENHKRRIFAKFDVQNQAHAVAMALQQRLLPRRTGSAR